MDSFYEVKIKRSLGTSNRFTSSIMPFREGFGKKVFEGRRGI